MNTNRSNLLRMALRTLAISAAPVSLHAQEIISINFGANETNGSINTGSALAAGALPIAGSFWNNASGAAQGTPQALINDLGAPSGASVTWSSNNTWRSGSPGGTGTSQNGNLTKGYLDDGGAGCVVNVANVPFLTYNVYVIRGSDQGGGTENTNATYRPVNVNGTNFQGNEPSGTVSTATIAGSAATTGFNWTDDDTLLDGRHFHLAPGQAGLSLVIRGNTGTGRGPIAGVQIENAYEGTLLYWDTDGATPGAGGTAPSGIWDGSTANWNNPAGDGAGTAWSGVDQAAVFSAGTGATGSYSVTVDGTQTTDAVILEEGNLTLTGGTVDLVNAAVVRSFTPGGTLTLNCDLTSEGAVSFDGAGSHVLGGTASHTGATNISSAFNLAPAGAITATSSVNINGSTAIVDGAVTSAGAVNLNGGSLLGEGSIVAGGNVNLANIGTSNNLTLTGNGSLSATGTLLLNRGGVTFGGNAEATVAEFRNQAGGTAPTLDLNDNAELNVTARMVMGDNSNAAITINQTGGVLNSTGTVNNPGGNDMANRWGHWGGGTTTYNLSGGTLNITGSLLYLSWDSAATLNIGNTAVANVKGFNMGFGTRVQASTINLNAGGALNVGSDGIVTGGTANKTVNLNGGTLGALADWTGTVPVTLLATSTVDTTGGDISLTGAITGTGNLNLAGGGTVVLGGANTFAGTTEVTGNTTLLIGPGGNHSPDINLASGSTIGAGSLTTPGTGLANNVNAANGSGSVFRIAPLASDQLDVLDFNVDTSHTLTVLPAGTVAANEVYTLIPYQTLSGTGYAGIDVVSGNPRLIVEKEPDNGGSIDVRVVSFDSLVWKGTDGTNPGLWDIDTTVNWETDSTVTASTFLQDDVVVFNDSATTTAVTLSGAIAPASTTFDHSTLDFSLAGDGIGGIGGLTKLGTGTLELGNANTYLGNTVVEDGVLRITGSIGGGTVDMLGGSLEIDMADGTTYARPTLLATGTQMTFGGTGDMVNTGVINGDGAVTFDRDGTVLHNAVGTNILGTVTVNSGTLAIDGAQNATRLPNGKLVTVNNGGNFELRGVNGIPNHANSCAVTVEEGGQFTVVSGGSAATGAEGSSHHHIGNLVLNGGTVSFPYFGTGTAYNNESIQLNGSVTVGGTAPSIIEFGAGATNDNAGLALDDLPITFTVNDVTASPAADLTIAAEIENSDTGTGSLIKEGDGTLLLAGGIAHSHTGTTTVNAGTLAGTGSMPGPLVVAAAGTIAPGASAGTLATGDVTLAGTYACELDGPAGDTLAVTGSIDLTGSTLDISVLGGGATKATYVIVTYTGARTGEFAVNGLPGGYSVVYNDIAQRIEITTGADAYGDWETANGIAGAGADVDSDQDGIDNGIEFVVGGDPSGPGSDSNGLLPVTAVDATHLTFTFRRTDDSALYNPFVEYGSDLAGWTEAQAGVDGVTIAEFDDDFAPGIDRVEVKIPRALATGAKLFARLRIDIE